MIDYHQHLTPIVEVAEKYSNTLLFFKSDEIFDIKKVKPSKKRKSFIKTMIAKLCTCVSGEAGL